MATKRGNDRRELEALLDGVLDTIVAAPETEIDDDLVALGEDPERAAMETRKLALGAVEQHRTKRLEKARQQFRAEQRDLERREYDLPQTPAARLALLTAVLRDRPHLGGMLTVEHRELRELPDEDVTSCLRQLAELGVLDES